MAEALLALPITPEHFSYEQRPAAALVVQRATLEAIAETAIEAGDLILADSFILVLDVLDGDCDLEEDDPGERSEEGGVGHHCLDQREFIYNDRQGTVDG